ncbi:MAG: hypothetical protein K6T81_03850 [Alicyclobacillus macrosporangiidus]|uniref:hypothetical protein n=1 Tax=Alicyclobacillus macrosporangiidus TaxID=392015 RepID=UPI0026EDF572|nr:hypothetical protein [Alicyclobacillus macrosporangiidus]MCL6597853.1 hypothetical protein [Alicyclobacillus macrosporangiidus]
MSTFYAPDDSFERNPNRPVGATTPSGTYNPGPVEPADTDVVEAWKNDLQLEEFPDGPYGAATHPDKLGKSSPWRPGQQTVSHLKDQNPVTSDRKVAREEPPANAPEGTIESEN